MASSRIPTRKNTSVKNMVWAIGLNLAIVIVVAALVAFPREGNKYIQPEVDVADTARRAQPVVDFPLVAPQTPQGFTVRQAKLATGTPVSWTLRYSADAKPLQLVERKEATAGLVVDTLGKASSQGTVELDGVKCERFSGEAGHDALQCAGKGWAFIASGTGGPENVEKLARAAIASLPASAR
ncbi:DUF4245 family protein [Dermabacteraceae bacterium CCM 9520]